MKAMIEVRGINAVNLSAAINKLPEINDGGFWYQGTLWNARARATTEPECVRLKGSAKVFAETLFMKAINPVEDTPGDLYDAIRKERNAQPRTQYLLNMLDIVLVAMAS